MQVAVKMMAVSGRIEGEMALAEEEKVVAVQPFMDGSEHQPGRTVMFPGCWVYCNDDQVGEELEAAGLTDITHRGSSYRMFFVPGVNSFEATCRLQEILGAEAEVATDVSDQHRLDLPYESCRTDH